MAITNTAFVTKVIPQTITKMERLITICLFYYFINGRSSTKALFMFLRLAFFNTLFGLV